MYSNNTCKESNLQAAKLHKLEKRACNCRSQVELRGQAKSYVLMSTRIKAQHTEIPTKRDKWVAAAYNWSTAKRLKSEHMWCQKSTRQESNTRLTAQKQGHCWKATSWCHTQLLIELIPRCIVHNEIHWTNCCQKHDSDTQDNVARIEPKVPCAHRGFFHNQPNQTWKPERSWCKPYCAKETHQVCKQHASRVRESLNSLSKTFSYPAAAHTTWLWSGNMKHIPNGNISCTYVTITSYYGS